MLLDRFTLISLIAAFANHILWIYVLGKLIYIRVCKPKRITGMIVDKNMNSFKEYSIPYNYVKDKIVFTVTLNSNGKNIIFFTSGGFYDSLNIGDKGTVTYQYNRLLDFKSSESEVFYEYSPLYTDKLHILPK